MARAAVDVQRTDPAALASARADEASREPDWLHRLVTTMAATNHEQFVAWAAH